MAAAESNAISFVFIMFRFIEFHSRTLHRPLHATGIASAQVRVLFIRQL